MSSSSAPQEGDAHPPIVSIHGVTPKTLAALAESLGVLGTGFVKACGYKAEVGQALLVPGPDGALAGVLFGVEKPGRPSRSLPGGQARRPSTAWPLPSGRRVRRSDPRRARLRPRALSLRPLPQARRRARDAGDAG